MTARNLSHFKLKLRDISRELYLENDWQMPRGLMNSKDRHPRNFSLAELQQAKRMGHHARDLKAMMQAGPYPIAGPHLPTPCRSAA